MITCKQKISICFFVHFLSFEKKINIDRNFCSLSLSLYIYIYIYVCVCVCVCVLFGPFKPELRVIPSGQENYSRVNI